MTFEKKIITDELISEHKRAESLAKAIENITKTFKEIAVKKLSDHFKGKIEICKNDRLKIKWYEKASKDIW